MNNVNTEKYSPCIALIHGLFAREHMQRHLLRFLQESGYTNTILYGHLQAPQIAKDLRRAAAQGRPIVIIGYSQGGFEAVKVAGLLEGQGIAVDLLVTIAAGGLGRLLPQRWRDNPRQIPSNVKRCLNYFSTAEILGGDICFEKNLAIAANEQQPIENIVFGKQDAVSHLAIAACYPEAKVHPKVRALLLQRLLEEIPHVSA